MLPAVPIFGLGKLGAPLAAAIAWKGHRVVGVDSDPRKVRLLNSGETPVYEPGLGDLCKACIGRLTATADTGEAVLTTEASFIVVPTPSDGTGAFSSRYVLEACASIGNVLRHKPAFHLVVITSTLMPGTTGSEVLRCLEHHSGKRCGREFGLCYSPEFVALGSVVRDFLNPDFLLIGESDPASGDILQAFYHGVCENRPPVSRMNFVNAEIAKIAINTYITTKISFANMLGRICEQTDDGDVDVVTSALGLDRRIGPRYLK